MRAITQAIGGAFANRATLASLQPTGYGTDQVESMESYAEHLRSVHDVARWQLECTVAGVNDSRRRVGKYLSPRLDGLSASACSFAEKLAALTQQPQVARLGLGWMREVVTPVEALKQGAAWCAHCVRDFCQGRRPPRLPLLWSIAGIDACPIHEEPLADHCANCDSCFAARWALTYPYYHCPNCQVTLFAVGSDEAPPSSNTLADRLLAARQVGHMLAALTARDPAEPLGRPSLRKVIDSAVRRRICVGTCQFQRQCGISKGVLSSLLNGGRASLQVWIRVSLAADVSLPGLFAPELWRENVSGRSVTWRPGALSKRRVRRVDWEHVRSEVQEALRSGDTPGAFRMARELQLDPGFFKKMVGPLASQLDEAARGMSSRARRQNVSDLQDRLVVEAKQLALAGCRVSARALARQVGLPRHSLEFVLAIRAAAQRIGIPAYIGTSAIKA